MKSCILGLTALVLLLGGAVQAKAGTLWYNGDADGAVSYINQNNSSFQQILYNDFNVTGSGWVINSVWSNNIFTAGPPASTTAAWEIRMNMPTGTLVASGDALATLTPTGFTVFGSTEYQVLVSGLNVSLAPGTYWLAVYPDDTNGGFAGNDTTSGANAIGTPPGNNGNLYASFDGGATFGGPFPIDTSAGVAGFAGSAVPEPATITLLGVGIAAMFAYRLRRRMHATA
jgi:hypothetical protein